MWLSASQHLESALPGEWAALVMTVMVAGLVGGMVLLAARVQHGRDLARRGRKDMGRRERGGGVGAWGRGPSVDGGSGGGGGGIGGRGVADGGGEGVGGGETAGVGRRGEGGREMAGVGRRGEG